jgi:hypothetical protein
MSQNQIVEQTTDTEKQNLSFSLIEKEFVKIGYIENINFTVIILTDYISKEKKTLLKITRYEGNDREHGCKLDLYQVITLNDFYKTICFDIFPEKTENYKEFNLSFENSSLRLDVTRESKKRNIYLTLDSDNDRMQLSKEKVITHIQNLIDSSLALMQKEENR